MTYELLLIAGVLLGSLSPLLTFARLFQMKEWRLDRLGEHVRREGWFTSLASVPIVFVTCAYAMALASALSLMLTADAGWPGLAIAWFFRSLPFWTGVLAALTIAKFIARRQRMPVWTTKAILLVLTALALDAIASFASTNGPWLFAMPLLPACQSVALLLAWLLWKPADAVMKKRLLAKAAARRATFEGATVIGIVGSVGKTTTKELLKCLLADKNPIVTPEHVNTELGVAAWLLRNVPAGAKNPFLIVEMGAYRKGEIATLCRVARPTAAVVTALGSDHLALFGSEDAIVDANAEIFDALPGDGNVFLLGDNERTAALESRTHRPTYTVGAGDAKDLRETDRGLAFDILGMRFNAALHGTHNVGNAVLALTVANAYGIAPERLRELLAGYRGAPRTFHLRTERGITILDDTYNVSPLSFRAALDWAKGRTERPRVLLTSGLLETGSEEARFLRELGAAAKAGVERVVFTTDAGRNAFADGFGGPVELLGPSTQRVTDDGLLVCVGRMTPATIQRLLP